MNKQPKFTQAEIERAIKASRAAGLAPVEVTVSRFGQIRVRSAEGAEPTDDPTEDVREEIARHFRVAS